MTRKPQAQPLAKPQAQSGESLTPVYPLTAQVSTPHAVPAAAARRRKLGVEHFAFMRALVQGVDEGRAWERYLSHEGEITDRRLIRSTLAWIRDAFAAAAQREDRFGVARLVRMDLSKLVDRQPELPSLEAFAVDVGLEHYSQADQIAAYEERFGRASQRLQRRGRLVARQLEALRWLESLVAQPARAGDGVAAWLNPAVAKHLEAADIFTVAQLVERINGLGRRWYVGIRSLGAVKAERVLAWLKAHESDLGISVGSHVALARRELFTHELRAVVAPATDIRPLEKFIVPGELDGRRGLYRRPQAQCLLKATNDYEAILAWLRSKTGLTPEQKSRLKSRRRQRDLGVEPIDVGAATSVVGEGAGLDWLQSLSNTQRAYRKEAERFLLWAVLHKKKPLSSMNNEDCVEYRDFLADPQPRSRWCGARSRERWSPLWRPFEASLSPSAQRHAVTILKNLYGFLVDQNYLMGNPWSAVGVRRATGPKLNAGRSLTIAQWQFVRGRLNALERTSSNRRLQFAVHLLYATGLRLSEVTAATVDDLRWVEYPPDSQDEQALEGWLLSVVGKGGKLREVPVPMDVISELSEYLISRGLDPDPENIGNQGAHLLGKASDLDARAPGLKKTRRNGPPADAREGIAATTFYDQIKRFFEGCAKTLRGQGDHRGAERLERASTHWLRHSHASHAIAGGMPIEVAQQNLGHSSLATTTAYVTTEDKRRMRAVGQFWSGNKSTSR